MAKNWTEDNEQYIKDHFLEMTYADLAEHFDVSTKAMESKIRRMGLKKQEALEEQEAAEEIPSLPEPRKIEEPRPTPLSSIHSLPRKSGAPDESDEEREERIEATVEAAEHEKARREEVRSREGVDEALGRLEKGLEKMMAGDHAAAGKEFEAIVEASPTEPGVRARASQFLAACREHLEKAPPAPKDVDGLYLQGVFQMNAGELDAALESFEAAAEKAPDDDRIAYCQAAAHAQSGDVDSALDALRKAISRNDANRVFAKNDSDFTPLRVHKEFQELVAPPEEAETA